MRKQQKVIVWPSYVDSSKTRKEGRRISKSVGVPNPTLVELLGAAEKLKLKPEAKADVAHPSCPWRRTGRIALQRKGTKAQTVTAIAREVMAMRQQAKK